MQPTGNRLTILTPSYAQGATRIDTVGYKLMSHPEYSIYLASWEHLYLLPQGIPAGLPNHLFAQHPWLLIVFEHLYCDENGFQGEQYAAGVMKWTNSELFVRLATSGYGIVRPINVNVPLLPYVRRVKKAFKKKHGRSIKKAVSNEAVTVHELFRWRLRLLEPFLQQRHLILYDWPLAAQPSIPVALSKAVRDVLALDISPVHLGKDIATELSPERRRIFHELQEFEKKPLEHLRAGRMSDHEYLKIISDRMADYREVDMELQHGLDARLATILRLRDRFGPKGWNLVREFLAASARGAFASELNEIDAALRKRLEHCFKPTFAEYGRAVAKVANGLLEFVPYVGTAKDAVGLVDPLRELGELTRETVAFFHGKTRRGRHFNGNT